MAAGVLVPHPAETATPTAATGLRPGARLRGRGPLGHATLPDVASRADGTRFVGLVVGGTPVDGEVPPNTAMAVPGIGSVVLNAQACEGDGADATSCTGDRYDAITVTGLRVVVDTPNDLGLPVGATITVAVAHSEVAA